MSSILAEICAEKRRHVTACKDGHPLDKVEAAARRATPPLGFIDALKEAVEAGGYGLIAEIKKASPSKGLIRDDFDPSALARAYKAGGAACLSVLTDTPYFQGKEADLIEAREAGNMPALRKDFIIDPYQVLESRAFGADCILLIMAALGDTEAAELESVAIDYGLDVLAEVHDLDELERALKLKTPLIGINNRDLRTFEVDLATTETLMKEMPPDRIAVSESGLKTPEDLARLSQSGVDCFLVGESLMRHNDVEAATRTLLSPPGNGDSARA